MFKVADIRSGSSTIHLEDSSLLLLADILPTGVFAALQALQHPKLASILSDTPYPRNGYVPAGLGFDSSSTLLQEDRSVTIAVVGLGPVGMVSTDADLERWTIDLRVQ